MLISRLINRTVPKLFRVPAVVIMSKQKSSPTAKSTFSSSDNLTSSVAGALGENMGFQVLPTPVKSESDQKEYKVIRLANGLTATLVSDKSPIPINDEQAMSEEEESGAEEESEGSQTSEGGSEESEGEMEGRGKASPDQKMAAASLCIGVGSFSDPKDVPGMAHFLEHMVFMGSEKYPQENTFDAFIKLNGGSDNAHTDVDSTCFYFECLEKNLPEALDIFAQFFIAPLMKRDAMTREREAVESEFQMALNSDSTRKEQLLANLADKNSPVNCFAWGNQVTLKDNIADDVLYKGVHDFRKKHYSAHRMTLAIQARLPIAELEKYVLQCFSGVPNNGLPGDDFSKYNESVFKTPEFTRMYYIKPIKDITQVDLTWALPSLKSKYKSKPQHYVSYLLGHEGKGSVLSFLKKKVWALGITVGTGDSGFEHNSMYSSFTVSIVLTKQGLALLNETIAALFSYINLMKERGPQRIIFDEVKDIANISFKFAHEEPPVDFVEDLSESMLSYPPEDYIAGSELYYEYDPDGIKMVLDKLTPDEVNIIVTSKDPPENLKFDKKERWFGTEYTDTEIPKTWVEGWKNVKPHSELALPEKNPFITKDFSILPEVENHPKYPTKILETPLVELWYRQDQKFKLPDAYYYIYIISPLSTKTAKNQCMLDALTNLLTIDISEELYPATTAELEYDFKVYEKGIVIKVRGFNEKLPLLINIITKYLKTLSERISEDMFLAIKDKLLKYYYNNLLKPSGLAKDVRLSLIASEQWTPAEKYSAMLEISVKDVKQFIEEYFKVLKLKALVQGNVTPSVASKTISEMVSSLGFKELHDDNYPRFDVIQVPKGERCCRIRNFNTKDSNSIVTNYYQSGPFDLENNVILEIILMIIEEPLFDILRTKEQLGYHVYMSIRDTYGILGFAVTVNAQATKNKTPYVEERIENFLKHTQGLLAKMTEEDFNKIKNNLIKTKEIVDVRLKEEIDRNWQEIVSDKYIFDRQQKEIELIKKTTLKEVRKWWDAHNSFANKDNFRKLSIQVVGYNNTEIENNETPVPPGKHITVECIQKPEDTKENRSENYFIGDIDQFRTSLEPWDNK